MQVCLIVDIRKYTKKVFCYQGRICSCSGRERVSRLLETPFGGDLAGAKAIPVPTLYFTFLFTLAYLRSPHRISRRLSARLLRLPLKGGVMGAACCRVPLALPVGEDFLDHTISRG